MNCNKETSTFHFPNFSFNFVVLGTFLIVSEYLVDLPNNETTLSLESTEGTSGFLIKGSLRSSDSISDIECMYL